MTDKYFNVSLFLVQWRNEQSILDRQSQQGTTATNAQGKRRRFVPPHSSLLFCPFLTPNKQIIMNPKLQNVDLEGQ